MTPQELKNSILQLAVQGKLVEQRPEEGSGEELYQQIQTEKQKLIKEGKIKKEKPLPEIAEDEIPFDIPKSWKWTHIGEILNVTMGQSPKGTSVIEGGTGIEFHQGKIFFGEDYLQHSNQTTTEITKTAEVNSVLLCVRAPVGIANITKRRICIGRGLCAISTFSGMDEKFVLFFLRAFRMDFIMKSTGTTFKAITNDVVKSQCFPLPPLAEQKRIVAKIEELLPYTDRYEKAWSRLEDFNKRFPVDMQKSILQMAIQGKLVEQRPEEGTGEELYQQIQSEKQKLIKEGKIKKEKPLPEISEDEIPFDIPESWKWVRLRDIISVLGDGIHGTPVFDDTGDYYFINGNNLMKGSIVFKADTKKVPLSEYKKYKKPLDENTILISINGTIGNYAFYSGEPVILGKSACYFSVLSGVNKEFIRLLLNTKFFMDYAVNEATQTTIKNVSLKAMRMFPVPLPPLAEQNRIVAKLEEILPLCERLK